MADNLRERTGFETDVLIIGSGIAGCVTALQLADAGLKVALVTRTKKPEESNTFYAQGGIVYTAQDDSRELLTEDIIRAAPATAILRQWTFSLPRARGWPARF